MFKFAVVYLKGCYYQGLNSDLFFAFELINFEKYRNFSRDPGNKIISSPTPTDHENEKYHEIPRI